MVQGAAAGRRRRSLAETSSAGEPGSPGVLQPGFEGRILRQPGLVVARDEVSGGKFGGPCGKGKGPGQVGAPEIHQVSGQHNEVGLGLGEGLQEAAVLFSEGCVVQV